MPFDPDKYLESKSTGFNPDDYLKKKGQEEPLEVGSEDGGPSPIQDQPLSSGYQRILKAGKIPENPFEKAALKQPAIDDNVLPYTGGKPKEQQPLKQPSIYDLAVTDTENWYGAAPSPRKKIASFNEEAEVIKSRYDQLINSLGDPNNIDKFYDKEVSDLNKKYGIKFENGEYKFPDIEAKTDDEYNKQVPIYNEKIKQYNEEVGNINSRYKKNIADYNASIKRIGDYDKEIQDLAERLGLFIENGEVKVSQGEIDKYQEVYSRKLDERLSRISDAKKNPYIKDVITKLGSGSAGVLNMPYNAMALSEKAGNALLGLVGAEPSTYWQDFATYLNENKNELSQNAQRYEQDVLTMVGDGDMGGAIGKVGLDIAESLPMLATLVMGNAYGAAIGNTTQVGITNAQAAIKARNANKVNLAFMGGGKSAEEYMSMNNRTDLSEFAKIVEALGVGVSEILFEQEGTIKILNGIRKGIQDRGENVVRSELKNMLQTNMQRNMSLLMRGNSDMMRESISEGMTQLTDNIIKKALVDPSIDIWEGVTDSMISGGLIGKGINLSLNAANNVQTKGVRNAVKEAIKQVPQNYSLEAKEKIATLTLEKQAIQDKTKDAAKPIQEIVSPQIKAIDEEIKKIAAKEEGIELPKEEKPKEGEKKEPEATIPKSEVKVSPDGITSLKEEKTTDEPKGKITLTDKVPMSESDKGSLMIEGDNLFTRIINKDGKEFGKITVEEQGDTWKVKDVFVNKEKEGYGKEVYRQMNDMAQEEGKVIASGIPTKDTSKKATYMWESLVELGEARKNNDGSYQMFPSNMVKIVNDLKSGKRTLWHNTDEAENIKEKGFIVPLKGKVEDIRGVYVGDESTMELMYQRGIEFGEDFLEVEFKPKKPFIVDNYMGKVISEDIDFEEEFNGDVKKIEEYVKNKGYDSFININSSNGNIDEAIAFDPKILNIVGERKLGDKTTKKILPKKEEPIVEPKLTEEPTDASRILKDEGQPKVKDDTGGSFPTESRPESERDGGKVVEQEQPEQPGDEKERLARVKKIPQKLTHVEGLGMGMNQAEGVYFSTEKKNRYAKEGKKAREVVVSVRNPIEFDQQKGDFHKVRTTLLNENKDKFTEGDFEEYQVPKKNKFSVDDLNDAGVEKLAKIVTDHFKKQGYDSIHFTGEGEGELVVFDKKAWKYKEDVDRDIHNAIVSRVKDYNDLPSTHKTKKSSALKDINNLVSKAGYSILQKGQGKIQVLKDGKPIKKITKQMTKEELQSHKALKDYENKEFVDFVEKLSESGSIVGLYDTGINSRDIPKAIEEIQSGVKSAKSNDLLDYLEQAFKKGEVSIWDADSRVRIPIAIKDILDSISEKDVSDEYVGEVEQVGEVDEVEQFVMDYVDGKITDEELKEYKAKWFTGFPYTEAEFNELANKYRHENNAREKERAEEDEAVDKGGEVGEPVQEEKQPEIEPEIEPEVAKKLREVAGKIREGKISRIKGFQTNTPFSLAWDGGLEVLATTLEVTADLTVAVDKALTHIKNTDWYKNLTKEKQTEFDTKFVDHIENELGKEYRDATKYQFVNKEVGDRIQAATLSPKTFSEKAKEVFLDLRNKITRTYRDLPKNKKFAEAYNAISQFQKALDIASSKAGVNIRNILGNMQKADYDLFTYKIIFDDLAETIKLNPDYILPYALTPEALTQEIANINKFIGYNTKVQEAIKRRREAYKEIQGNYVEYAKKVGVNTEGYFERNDYFRHQVLLYSELSKSTVERKGGPLQRPKKLSLFKQRKQGKGYDINRNYIEAEFEVFNKLLYAIEKMKMIDNIYRNYDITKDLKAEAKKELGEDATPVQVNQWVEDNIPEGYVIDSPENMNIFMAQSIPESLVQDLMLGNVEEMGIKRDDLRKIFALGSPKKIIIPVELYKTMDNISQVKSSDSVSKATKKALTGWKIWSLIGPRRFIKYNLRNMSGDAEAVFLGNIRVFKKAWPAAKELYDVYFKKEPPTEMMNKYIERGGMQLVLTTQEIGDLKKIKEFEKVYDSKRNVFLKAWDAYWKTVKLASDFREQLLRYAAFKEWVSEIEKNNGEVKNYGASKPEFIDGLADKYDKAFRLSNELLGAYDEIGEAGQNIRQYWIPFWSFQEVNFRRTNQIFMNSLSDKSFEGKTLKGLELLAKKTPFMALKATKLALKLSAFWGMTAVWNALLFGDEEDDLPEYVTSRPHIIFGRNADGTVRYLSRLGVMGDYLEWFGFDSMPMYVSEYLAGRMTPREISKEVMLSGANKLIGGANPYFKSFFELAILKKSLYPDFNNPRVIRNNGEYVAIALGIKDEYRAITKLPDKEYYKSLRKLFWDEIEPKEAAYWNIIGYKYKFKAKQKGGDDAKSSFAITDKSAALYYYKQSLLYGDAKSAEHYLDKYILLGGTKKGYNMSMGYLNPMRGISDKEKDEFMKFIGSKNKKEFDMAMEYYDKVVNSKMEWPNDKMDKENEGDEIPMEEIPQE